MSNLISFTALIPRSGCVFNSFGPRIPIDSYRDVCCIPMRLPRSRAFALVGRRKEAPSEITAPNNSIFLSMRPAVPHLGAPSRPAQPNRWDRELHLASNPSLFLLLLFLLQILIRRSCSDHNANATRSRASQCPGGRPEWPQ